MKYVGRDPSSDYSVTTKEHIDDRHDLLAVDADFLTSATASAASAASLVTPNYVDIQDGQRSTKNDVDLADESYVPITARGAANGVASIGSNGYIPSAQLPALSTRKPFVKNVDQTFLLPGVQRVVTTQAPREYEVARLTIADPGFPYIPLPFATILGGSLNGVMNGSQLGTGNYAQISVLDASLVKWGWTVTSGTKTLVTNTCMPFADTTVSPISRPAVTGPLTLSLFVACWTGNTFTFDGTGLTFYALCYPARV